MTRKDWIDHRSEALTPGEIPVAIKRIIALEADDYVVWRDYDDHEIPVIEDGSQIHVYVPDALLGIAPWTGDEIEFVLDRNAQRGRSVAVHPYDDDEPEAAL